MRIAINTRFGAYPYLEGFGYFTKGISENLVGMYPDDEFLFIYDQKNGIPIPQADNLTYKVVGPAARHPFLWKYWFDYRLPAVLKKAGAEVFLSTDGFCSLRTKVPQIVVIHDIAFRHYPKFLPASQNMYYRYFTPSFLRKAKKIITVSEFSRQDIIKHYPFIKDRIEVVYNGADPEIHPLTYATKESVREKFTAGREFFLYAGSIHPRKNLINLLKAFSIFKKRQQTNMPLVIAGRLAWQNEGFTKALASYKYRDDVILTGYLPRRELLDLLGSCYALIYPSLFEGFGLPVLEAMKSGVGVLCSGNSAMPEIAGDAALYFDPFQPEDIARQMATVFKDETGRNYRIEKGLERARLFTWEKSAARVREILKEAITR